jgi:hypothetical protein
MDRADADLLAGAALAADIDLGGLIVADEDGGQSRRAAMLGLELPHSRGDALPHRRRHRFAVDDPRRHSSYLLLIGA